MATWKLVTFAMEVPLFILLVVEVRNLVEEMRDIKGEFTVKCMFFILIWIITVGIVAFPFLFHETLGK